MSTTPQSKRRERRTYWALANSHQKETKMAKSKQSIAGRSAERPSTPFHRSDKQRHAINFGRLSDELSASKEHALRDVVEVQVNVLTTEGESLVDPKGITFKHGRNDKAANDCKLVWSDKHVGSTCKVIVTSE